MDSREDRHGSRRKENRLLSRRKDEMGPGSLRTSSITTESQTSSLDTGYPSTDEAPVEEEVKEMLEILGAPQKLTDFLQKLLTYASVIGIIKLPITAAKLATAGFVVMETRLGYRYGCPDCKYIFCDMPDQFDCPQALHEFISPKCPHVRKVERKESTTESNNSAFLNSGFGPSLADRQSLITINKSARNPGASGFHDDTEHGSQEGVQYDEIRKSKIQNTLRGVSILTRNYTMRRSKLNRSLCVERNRQKTFKERHSLDTPITKKYASSGLHLTEEPKGNLRLQCAWCEFIVDFTQKMATNKEVAKELLDKHVMDYHCDFITGREETMRNVPYLFDDECWESLTKHTSLDKADPGDQLSGLQINYQQAKHPGMAVFEHRKDSFLTFPTDSTQQPELLIETGYFYQSGILDTVTCFMCGVVSSDWSINETPWQRHARSSPTCQHVMSQKGEEFVRNTLEECGEYRPQENRVNESTADIPDGLVAQNAQEFGLSMNQIKEAMRNSTMAGAPVLKSLEEITRALHDSNRPDLNNDSMCNNRIPKVVNGPINDDCEEVIPSSSSSSDDDDDDDAYSVDSTSQDLERQDLIDSGRGKKDWTAINGVGLRRIVLQEDLNELQRDTEENADNIQLLAQGILGAHISCRSTQLIADVLLGQLCSWWVPGFTCSSANHLTGY